VHLGPVAKPGALAFGKLAGVDDDRSDRLV